MTDKKLTDVTDNNVGKITDNDITKTLKELLQVMLYEGDLQRASTISQTIDFINRLTAEIERLNNCVKSEDEVREIAKRTMEPLVREITREQIDAAVKLAKAEAYKEFAEKLKEKFARQVSKGYCKVLNDFVDNVLNKMVGGSNA